MILISYSHLHSAQIPQPCNDIQSNHLGCTLVGRSYRTIPFQQSIIGSLGRHSSPHIRQHPWKSNRGTDDLLLSGGSLALNFLVPVLFNLWICSLDVYVDTQVLWNFSVKSGLFCRASSRSKCKESCRYLLDSIIFCILAVLPDTRLPDLLHLK